MVIARYDVDRGLRDGEFVPHFQPIVNLRTGELHGFEMLARWRHPEHGWIPPDVFIPYAERDGWIADLTQDLIRQALPTVLTLPSSTCTLAVNISPLRLRASSLPSQMQMLAASHNFPLSRLMIEVTESALMEDVDQSRIVVHELKEMGCRLALDDFGTGYSSLAHLQSLPFDELKVDRSFVQDMTTKRNSRKIVSAVIGLGQSLGLATVAEGVETPEQVEMLLWLGCELGQGWLYGRPVAAEQVTAVVTDLETVLPGTNPSGDASRPSFRSLESLPSQQLAQLQAVYDGAPVGLAFLDRELRYRSLNPRLANLNSRPLEDHLGRTVAEMVPELFPIIEPYMRRALQGESIFGIEINRPAVGPNPAKMILVSYEPARDEADEVIGISVAVMDISALKRAQKAHQESKEHFRHLMDLLPQIPWVIAPDGRAIDVSHRWLELSGMQGDEWRDFGWLNALHPDDLQPTLDIIQLSVSSGDPIDVRYRLRPRNSDWIWVRARGLPRRGPDGEIVSWYGSLEPDEES